MTVVAKKKKGSDDSLKGAGTMGKAARQGANTIKGKASHSRLQHIKIQEAFDKREAEKKAGKKPSPISPAMLEGVVDESGKYIDEGWYGKLSPSEKEAVQKIRRKRMGGGQLYERKYPTKGVADLMSGEYLDGGEEDSSIDKVKTVYEKEYETTGSRINAKAKARDEARKLNIDDKLTFYPDGTIMYTSSTPSEAIIDKKERATHTNLIEIMEDIGWKWIPELIAETVPDETDKKKPIEARTEDIKDALVKFVDRSGDIPKDEKVKWKKKIEESNEPLKIRDELRGKIEKLLPIKSPSTKGIVEKIAVEALLEDTAPTKASEKVYDTPMLPAPQRTGVAKSGMGEPIYGRMFGLSPIPGGPALPGGAKGPVLDPQTARIFAQRKELIRAKGEEGLPKFLVSGYAGTAVTRPYEGTQIEIPKGAYIKINPAIMSKADVEKLMKKQKISNSAVWKKFHDEGLVTEKFWEPIVTSYEKRYGKKVSAEPFAGISQTELQRKLTAQKGAAEAEMVAGVRGIKYKDTAREEADKTATTRWVMKKDPKTGTMKRVKEAVHMFEGETAARKWTPEEGVTKVIVKPGARTAVIRPDLELTESQKNQLALMRTESIRNLEKQIGLMHDRQAAAKLAAKYIKKYSKKPAAGYRVITIERAFAKQYPVGRWKLNIRMDRKNELAYLSIIAPTSYEDPSTKMTVSPYGSKYELDSKITQILDHMNLRPAPGAEIEEYRLPVVGKKHMSLKYRVKVAPL
jgi:hypothetical protein